MKHLDEKATQILRNIIDQVDDDGELHLYIPQGYSLFVQRDKTVETPFGLGTIYSLSWRDKDFNRCPEMYFLVMDYRKDPTDRVEYICAYPAAYFADAPKPTKQRVLSIRRGRISEFLPKAQVDLTIQANSWLSIIEEYGYLK